MVGKSAKKSNTTKTHSNGNYEVGGMVFPSYDLFDVLKEINKYFSYFYTPEETDYFPIFDSPARHSDDFDDIYKNIKYYFFVFKNIYKNDSRVSDFFFLLGNTVEPLITVAISSVANQ